MQKRNFLTAFVALAAGLLISVSAQAQLTLGRDYVNIEPPQPTDNPAKIEVVEFFSYGCPHCNDFHPLISKWASKLPADVSFRRVPVSFGRAQWANIGKLYYAAEAIGELGYDAAHAFGVRLDTDSLMAAGDAAILSFHATKVFHTFEGGAIVCRDEALKARIDLLRNFGFKGETRVLATGINAKMNELQAAFGCLTLGSIDAEIAARAAIAARYRAAFAPLTGLRLLSGLPGVARHNHG